MKHIIREQVETPDTDVEKTFNHAIANMPADTCLSEKEDLLQAEELGGSEWSGENGEHECLDGTDGVGNIDGTDGHCVVCGKTNLI